MKPECFVIMPIGNPETEFLWDKVYRPVAERVGFTPVRSDKSDDGTSIHQQIEYYLNSAPLLIADLTFSRPNCYFEVGYVMGRDRRKNLILSCREDHSPDSADFNAQRNKIHFDVYTYSIIWWTEDRLDEFAKELESTVRRRKKMLPESTLIRDTKKPELVAEPPTTKTLDSVLERARKELGEWKRSS